ncbi:MAG: peptide-methionine (S)-S-oxide reductase MsrA [Pisciglobus halotolerans]|nr:peptide-methionine (S)-S-oxide reductase MsrA [Pisciglobus halotolerans]
MKEKAVFAGGCFWCMVSPFEEQPGIEKVISGYTGGTTEHPTYEQVKSQLTGHTEAVEITFDPEIISYAELINIYWQQTDPTDAMGQFQNRGSSYRPVIFTQNAQQQIIAENSKKDLEQTKKYKQPIVTQIEKASAFYPAEEEHQDFHKKNPEQYKVEKKERLDYSAQ